MRRRKLRRNRVCAVILVLIGVATACMGGDATFLVVALMAGAALFFTKKTWIYGGADERTRPEEKRVGMYGPDGVRSH